MSPDPFNLEACPLNKSDKKNSLDVGVNRFFVKVFKTDGTRQMQFDCKLTSNIVIFRPKRSENF